MTAIGSRVLKSAWNNALPLSITAGGLAGARIGINLCTIWAPIPVAKASSFCLFYIMPQCAFIGASLVFITYFYGIGSFSAGLRQFPEEEVSQTPSYIEDVPGDGDCLLHAALKHQNKNRKFFNRDAALELRKAIAEAALAPRNDIEEKAIINDIAHARQIAIQANERNASPFSHLFTDNMNNIFNGNTAEIVWNRVIGKAYKNYLLTPYPKAYLDQYAIHYLNRHFFNNRLLVVQPNEQGRYINGDAAGFNIQDISKEEQLALPILLKAGEHYQYIDSSNTDFWELYNPTR